MTTPPLVAALAVVLVGLGLARPCRAGPGAAVDCRYDTARPDTARRPPAAGAEAGFLPSGDVFRPLLADPKQPRLAAGLRRVHFEPGPLSTQSTGDQILAGVVSFGASLGVYRWAGRHRCDGIQIGLMAGVFSQFNLDDISVPLINSDFVVGIPATARWGRVSGRLQLSHQSSHLGDEFILLNPQITRRDLGYELLNLTVSWHDHWWRVYAGGGYILHAQLNHFDRGMVQAGGELRAVDWQIALGPHERLVPTAGVDATSFGQRDWGVTVTAKAGLGADADRSGRHLRVLAVFTRGFYPFGQFFSRDQWTNFGLDIQFEY